MEMVATVNQADIQRPAWAEIDLDALAQNYREVTRLAGPDRRVIASIKGNAYGHGVIPLARRLAAEDAFALWTGNTDEAASIRDAGIEAKTIMFGGYLPQAIPALAKRGLIPTIYDEAGLAAVAKLGAQQDFPVYIKVDSGLGRLGVPLGEAQAFIRSVVDVRGVELEGVYSHLPFADSRGKDWALGRFGEFQQLLAALRSDGIVPKITQIWGSAGLVTRLPDCCNAVCVGQLLYGIWQASPDLAEVTWLRPVLRAVKAKLIHVGRHSSGDDLAIAGQYRLRGSAVTGVIAIGASDGLRRPIEGQEVELLLRGKRVPLIGYSFEHSVVDLASVPEAEIGEEVLLLGECMSDRITLADWKQWWGCAELDVLVSFGNLLTCSYDGSFQPPT